MENTFVFIYSKENKIKALGLNDSIKLNDKLLAEGWVQTKTLDAAVWIEYLHNNCGQVLEEVKSLTTIES